MATLGQEGDNILATSSFWVSDAWPASSGAPSFVNAVCQIQPFDYNPVELLKRMHAIEAKFGRQRDQTLCWPARSLDLDLLDYNGKISKNDSFLRLPHDRLSERDFVLLPLSEVSPNWVHPENGQSVRDLLRSLSSSGATNNCRLLEN